MYLKTLEEFKNYVENLMVQGNEQLLIFVGEKSAEQVEEIRAYLNDKQVSFLGGIFSRLLVRNKCLDDGFVVNKFEAVYSSVVFPYLMRFKESLEENTDYTAIVLVDGLSSRMKDLTDTLYSKLGKQVKYIGGGAGFYDLRQRPCLFDNNGMYSDALLVCVVKSSVNLAVKHGWRKLQGPYKITESRDNVVVKLDDYNAFDIYRDVIEEEAHITLYKEDFFTYAKDHPFGISQYGKTDLIVRDPISLNDNYEIVCVADIPLDKDLFILKGDIDTLLSSSVQIAEYCSEVAPEKYKPLLFNCISRAMFMEERFEEELHNIQDRLHYSVEGALSIGEIASMGSGELVIHNKSTILGLLEV